LIVLVQEMRKDGDRKVKKGVDAAREERRPATLAVG